MLPAPADLDGDTLPSEFHPSFLFGDPFHIHNGPHTLQPIGSSQPKLSPRLHAKLALHGVDHVDDVLATVSAGPETARAAIASKKAIANDSEEDDIPIRAYRRRGDHVELAPHLQMRASTSTAAQPPHWPFKRFGPGPSARPYAALFHADCTSLAYPEVDVWADFALESLAPKSCADSYTIPATLQHPYIATEALTRTRPRPSAIPPALGHDTAQRDELWLDERDEHEEKSDADESTDTSLAELSILGARHDPFAYVPAGSPAVRRPAPSDVFDERSDMRGGLFAQAPKSGRAALSQEERDFRRTLLSIYQRKTRATKRTHETQDGGDKKPRSDQVDAASMRATNTRAGALRVPSGSQIPSGRLNTRAPSGRVGSNPRVMSASRVPSGRNGGIRTVSHTASHTRRPAGWDWRAEGPP